MFDSILKAFDTLLLHKEALAVLLGLLVAIAGTQYVKRLKWTTSNRWWIRAIALPLGFFTTFFMWPVHQFNATRFFVALAVGVSAPMIYQGVTLALYWKWPQLEKHLSAKPE